MVAEYSELVQRNIQSPFDPPIDSFNIRVVSVLPERKEKPYASVTSLSEYTDMLLPHDDQDKRRARDTLQIELEKDSRFST